MLMDIEPVKVVKNPDGSLAQAAIMQVRKEFVLGWIWELDL